MSDRDLELLAVALHQYADVQGTAVSQDRVDQLLVDLDETRASLDEIIGAMNAHRLEVGHFPRIHELRARLGLGSTGARKRIDTWGRPMNSCPHEPGCRSMTACRDRILEDARAERAIAERAS